MNYFVDACILEIHIYVIEINNCQGDLTDVSGETRTLLNAHRQLAQGIERDLFQSKLFHS